MLAGAMQQLGLNPGDRVAVLGKNSFRNLEIHLACAHANLVLVPINTRLASAEIDRILDLTRTRLLLQAIPYESRNLNCIRWNDEESPYDDSEYERFLNQGLVIPAQPRLISDTAEIYFTSGTTGDPKGVCLSDQNLIASALDAILSLELSAKSVWFHASPMFHLVDAFAIWAITIVGGCHITQYFEPSTFSAIVERTKVTVVSLPPTLLDMITRNPSFGAHDVSSLNRISFGGAPMSDPIYQRCIAAFGCPLLQSYGTTETSGIVCQQMPYNTSDGKWINSIGQPAMHIKVGVVNDEGVPLAAGEVGELVVAGPRVMLGYWENEAATTAAFHNGFYLTGDLGCSDENGHFWIVGRKKEMMISGGENVYPSEVENALLSHPDVVEAAVFGTPHESWGEVVTAVVVLREDSAATTEELTVHCRALIGGYKIPKSIEVWGEELPKSGAGKIEKAVVRKRYLEVSGLQA